MGCVNQKPKGPPNKSLPPSKQQTSVVSSIPPTGVNGGHTQSAVNNNNSVIGNPYPSTYNYNQTNIPIQTKDSYAPINTQQPPSKIESNIQEKNKSLLYPQTNANRNEIESPSKLSDKFAYTVQEQSNKKPGEKVEKQEEGKQAYQKKKDSIIHNQKELSKIKQASYEENNNASSNYHGSNFHENQTFNKNQSYLVENGKKSAVKMSGFAKKIEESQYNIPEDSIIDYGQTTIGDLNKIQVNFHL